MSLQPGEQFGRYELVSWLGRGGMAETYRARLLGEAGVTKPVLIKKVLPEYTNDQAFTAMFISEARISATLSHGNIAQVYDFGRVAGEYFLAMEYVDGQPLHRILKRARKMGQSIPLPLAAFIVLEMCRGLHYAHLRTDDKGQPLGIVHRDISPDNVLISYEGQVKIVDFGIAKARELRGFSTEPGIVKGKYLFFSPEQATGQEVDALTDVWATGIVLYELLCGKLPIEDAPDVAMPRIVQGQFPRPRELNPGIPAELEDIVMKALAVKREARFPSCHAFGDALASFLAATAPRFSAMSLAQFIQELFSADIANARQQVQGTGSLPELPVLPDLPDLGRSSRPPTAAMSPTRGKPQLDTVPDPTMQEPASSHGRQLDTEPDPTKQEVVDPRDLVDTVRDVPARDVLSPRPPVNDSPVPRPGGLRPQADTNPDGSTRQFGAAPKQADTAAAPPADSSLRMAPPRQRRGWIAGAVVAGVLVVGALAGVFFVKREGPTVVTKPPASKFVPTDVELPSEPPPKPAIPPPSIATAVAAELAASAEPTGRIAAGTAATAPALSQPAPGAEPAPAQAAPGTEPAPAQPAPGTEPAPSEATAQTGPALAGTPAPPAAPPAAEPAPVLSKKEQEAMKAYESATKLYDGHKYAQAASKAQRCIALMPKNAECHRLAGAAVSGLGQFDNAVKHYRRFLALAPDHELAPQIRKSVARYEQSKRKQPQGQ